MSHMLVTRVALRRLPIVLNAALATRAFASRSRHPSPPREPQGEPGKASAAPNNNEPNANAKSSPPPPPPPLPSSPSSSSPSSPSSSSAESPQESPPPPPPHGALSLDFSPKTETEIPNERTGARSAKGSLSSIERRRRFMGRTALGIFALGIGFGVVHLGRAWEPEELSGRQAVPQDAGRWGRTAFRFKQLSGLFSNPQWEELLPPPLGKDEQRPYTLLLSIDDLLVTSTWDRQHGWRTAKRPGVDYFLGYIQQWFEIVIFTTQPHYTADPIIEKLDPLHALVTYRLFREATRYHEGKLVKDLSFLNRDLSRVVAVDTIAERYSLNRENAVILPKWTGDPQDRGLVGIIPFLESIGIYSPKDVRPIVGAYVDKDVVSEYAKAEAEAKRRHVEEWERKGGRRSSAPSFLGKLFGTSGSLSVRTSPSLSCTPLTRTHSLYFTPRTLPLPPMYSPPQSDKPPPTYLEKKRIEAQRNYRLDQEYLKRNEESIKKWLQDQQDASLKAMGSSSLFGALTGWGRTPGEPGGEGARPAGATVEKGPGVGEK
ncbi:HAD-like protein [Ramaria rubella]|nr:HAD-like protein [Ramaria rubella]